MTILGDMISRLMNTRLFRRPATQLSPFQVIGWWELRRVPYNVVVGATGILSVAIMAAVAFVCEKVVGEPIGMPDPPIIAVVGIFVYGVMANVCFTGGWALELFLAQAWGLRPARFRPVAFGLGLLGSVFITLSPAVLTALYGGAVMAFHALGVRATREVLPE
jgi:hypothetical protein